ncbi:type VI secretion system baseplate subunit TssG [Sulfitobacter albidus]|uniref:Type VI secretion system baseplate subunit TssG n=1 Tax=Sulfitobacter albidus TaxID=2829501 RepID=A0A975JHY0_9RHOB|nr:type VI secretion system baseplate subunit TssG [Sulfitobacter albidus]
MRAFTGDASAAHDGTAIVDDTVRVFYTPLMHGRVRSPVKLREMLCVHFGVEIRVEEFVTSWLDFPAEDQSCMGLSGMSLGRDLRVGKRAPSINEKIVLHVECASLDEYRSFLPGRTRQAELKDLVIGYTGGFLEVDVALWLPRRAIGGAALGTTTELGWTSAMPQTASAGRADERALVRACQYAFDMENNFLTGT